MQEAIENNQQEEQKTKDSGLLALVTILRFFNLPADAEQIRHQFGKPGALFVIEDLQLAAKRLKLKSRIVQSGWERLAKTNLPAIAEIKNGSFVIVAKIDVEQGKVLVQDPIAGRAVAVDKADFEDKWSGRLLLATRRAAILGQGGKFDISWFVAALSKYRRIFIEVLIASFFLQLFALISPLFFQVVIDKVLVHRGLTTLDVLVFGLLVVSVFEVLLGTLRTYIFSHTTNRVDVELGARLFRHLLSLPMGYFQARQVGQSVARVRELESIRNFITGSALTLVIDLFFTIVFFAVMWHFSPLLTMIVLGSIPFFVILAFVVTPVLRKRLDDKFQRGAENQAFLVESVTGVETLKALAVEPQMQRRWEEQLAGYVHSSFKTANLGNVAGQLTQLISKITTVLTLYFGATAVVGGDMTVGQLVAFNMLAGRVTGPILRLAQLWNDFQQARISIDRLGDILNSPTEPTYNPNRSTLNDIKGDIKFDLVTFRYRPDGPEILRRVDLSINAGEVVGIVGPSGSGKSTLTKLVQRMYVPESGRVLIDGIDLSMVDTAWLRRQVGVVLQENILFNRSLRENIALADPGMPMERVIEAAKLAGAHEFILSLSDGYDTKIGERGSNLSGGQRQRVAIARALVNNPRILIFDEATSALDYESEKIIQENMRRICKGRTVLIIAHRLAAVRDADRIITVEAGQVIEDGTHEELLRNGGRYSKLYQLQAGTVNNVAAQ
ncbi:MULTISPECIES: type I secretion system permease/ATPase [Thalassospira]|uniref:type I secretion system permease/ATPase n=1 Tax=Thalassospira TaxID=168934 RepID=UPI000828014C|nr:MULTISPECIES: type I secretion system permease/ATPase [Thalassospira]MDM7974467.1 type I secretion system permease/ATPase [Thalassospira xiamenensis]OCK06048.1 type I secretion system ATPase [Thalassospira sp. KO164]SED51460.1 ATP-binding cassette, subfamily B, HlyB/CyaB [Thalassospira permensis]